MEWRARAGSGARSMARAGLRVLPDRQRMAVRRRLGHVYPWEPGAGLTPPPCPPGMVTGPPDFIGVGVQKAGTSWWFNVLCSHPGVFQPPWLEKERHYFGDFFERDFGSDDAATYARWFPRPTGQLAGEWTPDYLCHFWIPPLLQAAAPQAKILVMLRDPVTRWHSGVSWQQSWFADPALATAAYFRGRYFEQLSWLTAHVVRGRVLVQQYERLALEPEEELARTLDFLELPRLDLKPALARRINETSWAKRPLTESVRQQLVSLYRDDVEHLAAAYPEIDLALWPNFSHLA